MTRFNAVVKYADGIGLKLLDTGESYSPRTPFQVDNLNRRELQWEYDADAIVESPYWFLVDAAIAEGMSGRHIDQVFIEEVVQVDVPLSDAAVEVIVLTAVAVLMFCHKGNLGDWAVAMEGPGGRGSWVEVVGGWVYRIL